MSEQQKAAALTSSTAIDERQPHPLTTDIISQRKLDFNGIKINPLRSIDGKTLLEKDLPPISFTIDKILPQGLFILAGSPKVGKSWLSLDMCTAVATGGKLWTFSAEQGDVLYLALEDSYNRLQTRLKNYADDNSDAINLHLCINSNTLQDGLIVQVTDFIVQHPNTRLIIIDTLQHIRTNGNEKNAYFGDYRDMNTLREITNHHKLSLILVTHTRKMDDPDPLNTISGSTGLIGAVDGVFLLEKSKRSADEGKLTIANRDTEGYEFKLEFDKEVCRWIFVEDISGNADEHDEPLLTTIDDFLTDQWEGTATELCKVLSEKGTNLNLAPATLTKQLKVLNRLFKKNNIDIAFNRTRTQKTISLKRTIE